MYGAGSSPAKEAILTHNYAPVKGFESLPGHHLVGSITNLPTPVNGFTYIRQVDMIM